MEDSNLKEQVLEIISEYMKSGAFTDRKLTDVPTDALSVVNRKYVTRNGTFATRPPNAIKGQFFFATDLATNGLPSWYNSNNKWVSATGSILGAGL